MQRNTKLRVKVNMSNLPLYIILVPFLFPRGFSEYFLMYHNFQMGILGIAAVFMLLYFVFLVLRGKITKKWSIFFVILYHIVLLVITLLIQSGISEGLQKIFFTPAFFILCTMQLKKNWYNFLNVFANILIIDFILNIVVFNQWFFPKYFLLDNHITFIGHVQVLSQMGLLSMLIGYIILPINTRKSIILISLGFLNMLYSTTMVSYIALSLLFIGIIIINKQKKKNFINPVIVFWILQVISICIIYISCILKGNYFIMFIDVSINGRMFIWNAVLEKLNGHWLFGYGAFGTLFKVFWNSWSGNLNGSNYAHNEILQLLLDGGVILLFLYIFLVLACIKEMNKCRDCKEKRMAVLILYIFLVVAIVESITEYYYYFGFLVIISNLYVLNKQKDNLNF